MRVAKTQASDWTGRIADARQSGVERSRRMGCNGMGASDCSSG